MVGKGVEATKKADIDIYCNPLAIDVLLFLSTTDRNSADVYDLEKHILELKRKGKKINYDPGGDKTPPEGIRGLLGYYEEISNNAIPERIREILDYFDKKKITYRGGLREITLTAFTGREIAYDVIRNTQKFEEFVGKKRFGG